MQNSSKANAAKVIAIIAFSLVMTALAIAIISDVTLFAEQVMAFIGACLVSVMVFFFGCILFIVSIAFLFGIYLLDEYGFWPVAWTKQTFAEILKDYAITQEQIATTTLIRTALIIICISVFVLSIVALSLRKSATKDGDQGSKGLTISFGVVSLILSILGIFMCTIFLLIVPNLA